MDLLVSGGLVILLVAVAAFASSVYAWRSKGKNDGPGTVKKGGKVLRAFDRIHLALLGVVILVVGGWLAARTVIYLQNACDKRAGVEEEQYIDLNGQQQYCLIRGEDVRNPVIIWVHGGPAGPDTEVMYYLSTELQDDYTFIGYNQRGSGRTYFANEKVDPENETADFETLEEDLDALVDYARERFSQEKVILVGHSFGTMVGSRYATLHPEKVAAYIGVGQMGRLGSEQLIYEDARANAEGLLGIGARANAEIVVDAGHGQTPEAVQEDLQAMDAAYEAYQADSSISNLLKLRAATDPYHPVEKSGNYLMRAVFSPYTGLDDIRWLMKQNQLDAFIALNQKLFDYVSEADVYDYDATFEVPVGFISGSCDWVTPVAAMQEYCDAITAPKKEVMLMEGWGHTVPQEAPEEFGAALEEMIAKLQ